MPFDNVQHAFLLFGINLFIGNFILVTNEDEDGVIGDCILVANEDEDAL